MITKETFQKFKVPILVIVGLLVLFVIYNSIFKKDPDAPLLKTTEIDSTAAEEDKTILPILAEITDVVFDKSFFNNPTFQSLENFNQTIIPEDKGRSNPFEPSVVFSSTSNVEGLGLGFEETAPATTP